MPSPRRGVDTAKALIRRSLRITEATARLEQRARERAFKRKTSGKLTDAKKKLVERDLKASVPMRTIADKHTVSMHSVRKIRDSLPQAPKKPKPEKSEYEQYLPHAAKLAISMFRFFEAKGRPLPRTAEETRQSLMSNVRKHSVLKQIATDNQIAAILSHLKARQMAPIPDGLEVVHALQREKVLATYRQLVGKTKSPITDTAIEHKIGVGAVVKLVDSQI